MSPRPAHPVLAAVAAAALVVPLTQVAGAESPTGQRAPATGEIGYALIQGQVVDKESGKPLDGVEVRAVRHKVVKGMSGASDLSYASPDNEVEHGYFALHVPHGTYTVTWSTKDYVPMTREVRRRKEQRAGLGEVELKQLPETRLQVGNGSGGGKLVFKEDQRRAMALLVRLGSDADGSPAGTMRLLDGKDEVTSAVVDGRSVKVGLGRLEAGKHPFTVAYSGDAEHRSAEKAITVVVLPGRG